MHEYVYCSNGVLHNINVYKRNTNREITSVFFTLQLYFTAMGNRSYVYEKIRAISLPNYDRGVLDLLLLSITFCMVNYITTLIMDGCGFL